MLVYWVRNVGSGEQFGYKFRRILPGFLARLAVSYPRLPPVEPERALPAPGSVHADLVGAGCHGADTVSMLLPIGPNAPHGALYVPTGSLWGESFAPKTMYSPPVFTTPSSRI